MPQFTNRATLTFNGVVTNSNTVVGEFEQNVSATKTALVDTYTQNGTVTYLVNLINGGSKVYEDLTASDDLGAYTFGDETLVPLDYVAGSVRYFVNGVLQATPTVTLDEGVTFGGLDLPANANGLLIYEARANSFASPVCDAEITNTVTIDGGCLIEPITAEDTVTALSEADLSITKDLCPCDDSDDCCITYTITIRNTGCAPVTAEDDTVLTDTFDPILTDLTVTFNGDLWTEGENYTYDETTGEFVTLPGQITVPGATFEQNEDGTWTGTPGESTLIISGCI